MSILAVTPPSSTTIAVGAASAQFATSMNPGELWGFASTTACAIAQGANPTASAGAGSGSVALPAGQLVVIDGTAGAKLAVIQQAAGGFASLFRLRSL